MGPPNAGEARRKTGTRNALAGEDTSSCRRNGTKNCIRKKVFAKMRCDLEEKYAVLLIEFKIFEPASQQNIYLNLMGTNSWASVFRISPTDRGVATRPSL